MADAADLLHRASERVDAYLDRVLPTEGTGLQRALLEWMARDPEREVDARGQVVRDRGS